MLGKRKRRGWTAPGYNYMGPGNPLDNGPPVNQNDYASMIHDRKYQKILDNKDNPYFKWSDADEQWLKDTTWSGFGIAGKAFFHAKKLAYQGGFIGKANEGEFPRPTKRPREDTGIQPLRKNPASAEIEGRNLFRGATQQQTVSNKQENAQEVSMEGSSAVGSGNNVGLRETPIDNVDRPVTRGPPEYTFASLPYVRDVKMAATQWARDVGFRLTSPLDPEITQASTVDLNAGAGTVTTQTIEASDSTDVSQTSARWYDFYSTMYNYYHVLGARWHCTIENHKNEPIWVHVLHCNDEVPPIGATNEDIMCWKNTESHLVGSHAVAIVSTGQIESNQTNGNTNNVEGAATAANNPNFETSNHVNSRGVGPVLKLSGSYKPGQFRRQIHLDSEIENWTSVSANPALPERLLFRFKPYWNALDTNNADTYDRSMQAQIMSSAQVI